MQEGRHVCSCKISLEGSMTAVDLRGSASDWQEVAEIIRRYDVDCALLVCVLQKLRQL